MKDPEFIQMKKRFFLALLITLIFILPVILLIFNKFAYFKSDILKKVESGNNLVIFLSDNSCKKCNEMENILKENNVSYFTLNKDNSEDFEKIMLKIELSSKFAISPGIIYVVDGKAYANLVDIKNSKDLVTFIENHQLINSK